MRLALYTRPGCHLCDVAKEAIERVSRKTGEAWQEIDITTDPALEDEYGLRIPVVMLDGKEHGYWRVEEERLLRDMGLSSRE
jgi:glutaredoxin